MKKTKKELRQIGYTLFEEIDAIHPSWDSGECRGSQTLMNRAHCTLNSIRSTVPELTRACRSLYRLWSTFEEDYFDKSLAANFKALKI